MAYWFGQNFPFRGIYIPKNSPLNLDKSEGKTRFCISSPLLVWWDIEDAVEYSGRRGIAFEAKL
jgi:hypothetical protein